MAASPHVSQETKRAAATQHPTQRARYSAHLALADMHTGLSLAKPLKLVEISHNVSVKLTWTVSFNVNTGRIATELELWIPGAF